MLQPSSKNYPPQILIPPSGDGKLLVELHHVWPRAYQPFGIGQERLSEVV